ncbi:MAG: glycosyltransferase family protein [Elusimicrobia bacterium]|nr:glycosyltransferase family protein [Elusimicrobiota bacterium]
MRGHSIPRGRTVAIIQARMRSSRLPGKVLKPLQSRPVLLHVIERVRAAAGVDAVVVATSTRPDDDAIEVEARAARAHCFRGSESDVLERYFQAAKAEGADTVVRVTSDCPLYDPALLGRMLTEWNRKRSDGTRVDHFSNCLKRTFPRGLDVEIFSFEALEKAHREATAPEEREHVTLYMYRHPELFALENVENAKDLSSLRWTLDTEDDWRLIEAVYGRLYRPGKIFSTDDVLELIKREPALALLNAHVAQKAVKAK